MNLQPPKIQLNEGEKVLAEHEPGPWDVVYGAAEVIEYLGDEMYVVHYDGETETEIVRRKRYWPIFPLQGSCVHRHPVSSPTSYHAYMALWTHLYRFESTWRIVF